MTNPADIMELDTLGHQCLTAVSLIRRHHAASRELLAVDRWEPRPAPPPLRRRPHHPARLR